MSKFRVGARVRCNDDDDIKILAIIPKKELVGTILSSQDLYVVTIHHTVKLMKESSITYPQWSEWESTNTYEVSPDIQFRLIDQGLQSRRRL